MKILAFLTIENITSVASTIFWAMFYAWTAVSIFAGLYALAERAVPTSVTGSDTTVRYTGVNAQLGLILMIGGAAGAVVGWAVLPLLSGLAPFSPPSKFFSGGSGREMAAMAVTILSVLAFDFGVWSYLKSEEWTT